VEKRGDFGASGAALGVTETPHLVIQVSSRSVRVRGLVKDRWGLVGSLGWSSKVTPDRRRFLHFEFFKRGYWT